ERAAPAHARQRPHSRPPPPHEATAATVPREPDGLIAAQLRTVRPTPDACRVAKRRDRDRVELREELAAVLVELARDGEAVADATQPAGLFEERRELLVRDLRDSLLHELRLERGRGLFPLAERSRRTGAVGLRPAALDL